MTDALHESDLELTRFLASRDPHKLTAAHIPFSEWRKRDYDQETERLRLIIHTERTAA